MLLERLTCLTTSVSIDILKGLYQSTQSILHCQQDCKLSFQTHIKHLQSKMKPRIGFLFSNKASFAQAAQHTLVKLTILPILDIGDVIYKIASNTLLNKLDAFYHSAVTVPSEYKQCSYSLRKTIKQAVSIETK